MLKFNRTLFVPIELISIFYIGYKSDMITNMVFKAMIKSFIINFEKQKLLMDQYGDISFILIDICVY